MQLPIMVILLPIVNHNQVFVQLKMQVPPNYGSVTYPLYFTVLSTRDAMKNLMKFQIIPAKGDRDEIVEEDDFADDANLLPNNMVGLKLLFISVSQENHEKQQAPTFQELLNQKDQKWEARMLWASKFIERYLESRSKTGTSVTSEKSALVSDFQFHWEFAEPWSNEWCGCTGALKKKESRLTPMSPEEAQQMILKIETFVPF